MGVLMAKKVIRIDVSSTETIDYLNLTHFQGNLKDLSDENYEKLKKEIIERGFSFVIHVWKDKGKNYILDGHQRVRTIKTMVEKEGWGCPELPVVEVKAKNIKEAKFKVLSGTSQYGEMTGQGLHEFIELAEIELNDVGDSFVFPEIDFDRFKLEFYSEHNTDGEYDPKEDEVPDVVKIKRTKMGEVFKLGNHKLMCGDATSESDVHVLMGNKKADMVITDPPYNVDYTGKTKDALKIDNDKMDDTKFREFLHASFAAMCMATKPGGAIYVTHADSMGYAFRGALVDAGFLFKQCLVWVKNSLVMGRQDYQWRHEPILYGWKAGGSHNWYSDRKQTTVIEMNRPTRNDIHPTMKPIGLIEYMMINSSKPGHLVLDTFGGSGSTMIAAEKNGRHCNMMELDPQYCDVILERWATYTGKEPVSELDGKTWSEIKKDRVLETKLRKAPKRAGSKGKGSLPLMEKKA
jgi:DNA modification methylase